MATNVSSPNGFHVLTTKTSNIKRFYIDGQTATAIFKGDICYLSATSVTTSDYPLAVVLSTSNSAAYLGTVISIYNSDKSEATYLAASTAGYVEIETDPLAELMVQSGADGTALTQAAIGDSGDPTYTAGITGTGQSQLSLSESLSGSGSPKQFRILDIMHREKNVWGEHYIWLRVQAAKHAYLSFPNAI